MDKKISKEKKEFVLYPLSSSTKGVKSRQIMSTSNRKKPVSLPKLKFMEKKYD